MVQNGTTEWYVNGIWMAMVLNGTIMYVTKMLLLNGIGMVF